MLVTISLANTSTNQKEDLSTFKAKIRSLVTADPGLPHLSPTQSFWQPAHPTVSDIQLPSLPVETDVVIIGLGITGYSVTKALQGS